MPSVAGAATAPKINNPGFRWNPGLLLQRATGEVSHNAGGQRQRAPLVTEVFAVPSVERTEPALASHAAPTDASESARRGGSSQS